MSRGILPKRRNPGIWDLPNLKKDEDKDAGGVTTPRGIWYYLDMINIFYSDAGTDQLRVTYNRIAESLERIRAARETRIAGGIGKDSGVPPDTGKGSGANLAGGNSSVTRPSGNGSSLTRGAERVILIVPAQFTLEAEEAAFRELGGAGFFDLHIMSNNKLAQNIISETGGMGRTAIDRLGRAMLLRRIAAEHADELQIYKSVAAESSFIDMTGDFVLQLKQNNIQPGDLDAVRTELGEGGILSGKLHDMQIFASDYAAAMEEKYNDAEDLRAFVTGRVKDCSFVTGSEIWFYDFYSFTPRDLEFIGELATRSHGVNIALIRGEGEDYEASERTFRALKALAERRNLPFNAVECNQPEFARKKAAEKHLVRCASNFTMAETIASEILGLVRDKGYKYSDIAVLAGESEAMTRTIRRVLELYGIPVFADEKRSVSHSPAVELISAFLGICVEGYTQSNVMALLKTGLTGLAETEQINDFENYLKQYHINADRFTGKFKYGAKAFGSDKLAELETVRSGVTQVLTPLCAAFTRAEDVNGKTAALRNFMEALNLEETLEARAAGLAEFAGAGNCNGVEALNREFADVDIAGERLNSAPREMLDASGELGQIYGLLEGLLDQFCELMGADPVTDEEYKEILESSLKDIKVGLLPQAEGKVMIGSVTRSRAKALKALFIAGFNEGLIPRDAPAEGILTEYEISALESRGHVLSKSAWRLMSEDRLVLRKVLALPEEYLWLGYSLSDGDGQAMKPSNYLTDYKNTENLKEEDDIENRADTLDLIQSPGATLRRLGDAMRGAVSGYGLADEWKSAFNVLKTNGEPRLEAIEAGLFFDNKMHSLGRDKAGGLYGFGTEPAISPSRIEQFAACPFKHFIKYGLRPDEQKEFEISALEMGTVYHEILERFCRSLSGEHMPLSAPGSAWRTVTDKEIEEIISDAMKAAEKDSLDGLLNYGRPQQYRSSRVRKVCVRFASQLVRQVRLGQIDSMFFETGFGKGRTLPAVEIPTSFGTVRIEGKIDRIDHMKISGQEYIKIIDYKSGSKVFNKEAAISCLAVQLFVYLEGALGGDPNARPAGVFYSLIEDPSDETALDAVDAEMTAGVIADYFAKKYRLNGMLVSDEEVIRAIDPDALTSDGGTILAVRKTKTDNSLKANSGTELTTGAEFEEFRSSVRGAVAEICERLSGGEIAVKPNKAGKGKLPCEFCDYKAICLRE